METSRILKKMKNYEFDTSIENIKIFSMTEYKKLFLKMKKEYESILQHPPQINSTTKSIDKKTLEKELEEFYFMSGPISKYILSHFHFEHIFHAQDIELHFFTENEKLSKQENHECHEMIYLIQLCKQLYERDHKKQIVYYYPTLLKKEIPKHSSKCRHLGQNECNSGLTFVNHNQNPESIHNGDIVIFRKEEHCKVLIHELIHSNYRDLLLIRHSENQDFTKKFCTDYDILLNESYTEFHATILNIFYLGLLHDMKMGEIEELLQKEIQYGIYVYQRIMNYYGFENIQEILKVQDFCKKHLSQKTNVIAYYIFKPLQMLHLKEMNDFMKRYTKDLQIHKKEGVKQYRNQILEWLQEPNMQEKLKIQKKNAKKDVEKTLRMTLFESS
jgi:hypothetical protein